MLVLVLVKCITEYITASQRGTAGNTPISISYTVSKRYSFVFFVDADEIGVANPGSTINGRAPLLWKLLETGGGPCFFRYSSGQVSRTQSQETFYGRGGIAPHPEAEVAMAVGVSALSLPPASVGKTTCTPDQGDVVRVGYHGGKIMSGQPILRCHDTLCLG